MRVSVRALACVVALTAGVAAAPPAAAAPPSKRSTVEQQAGREPSISFLAHPELRFTAEARLTLDPRTAKRSTMRVDQPAARGGFRMVSQEVYTAANPYPYSITDGVDPRLHEVYAASTPGVRSDDYKFTNWLHAEEPDVELTAESPERFPALAGWLGLGPEPDLSTRLATVHAGRGTPEELAKVDARGKLVTLAVPQEITLDELATAIRNVKAAGGRLVYVVPMRPDAQLTAVAGPPDELPTFVLPTLVGGGVTGSRFVALSAKGGLTARLATKLTSRYRYDVAAIDHRAIRAVPNYDQATKDLAAVRARYYGYTRPGIRNVYSSLTLQGVELHQLRSARLAVPGERVEYFTPGRWNLSVSNWEHNIADDLHATPWNLRRGGNGTLEWNKAVHTPTFTGTTRDDQGEHPWVWRNDDLIHVFVPLYGDAAGHPPGAIRRGRPRPGYDQPVPERHLGEDRGQARRRRLPGAGGEGVAPAHHHRDPDRAVVAAGDQRVGSLDVQLGGPAERGRGAAADHGRLRAGGRPAEHRAGRQGVLLPGHGEAPGRLGQRRGHEAGGAGLL